MAISGEGSGSSVAEPRKWRLFVGNLAETVKQGELKEKFELLLNGSRANSEDVRVGNVEIRCKNQDNYFGFVDIHGLSGAVGGGGPPTGLYKVIDLMNNTKWKGTLIKVQLAKESFLDKLKRERAGGVGNLNTSQPQENKGPSISTSYPGSDKDGSHPQTQPSIRRFPAPRKPDNFDFEIVSNAAVKTRKTFPGGGAEDGKEAGSDSDEDVEDFHEEAGIPKFKGLVAFGFGQPQTSVATAPIVPSSSPQKSVQPKLSAKSEEAKHVIPEADLARFERFQRIAGYPATIRSPTKAKSETSSEAEPPKQNYFNTCRKQHQRFQDDNEEEIASSVSHPVPNSNITETAPKGVVFRKHKQENSDRLRQQSLNKMSDLKTQQSNIIKSSLSQSNISNNFENSAAETSRNSGKGSKKPKMDDFLFGGEGDDDEDTGPVGHEFKLKKQYETAEGQRLLELRGKWGHDERFQIDERFTNGKDTENGDGVGSSDLEKQQQMNILSDVLGSSVTLRPKSFNAQKKLEESHNSVIISRYDPDNDPDPIPKSFPVVEKDSKKLKSASKKSDTPAAEPVLIRSNEPATYKTVSNLKSLFSSQDNSAETSKDGGFSLLATFGGDDANHDNDEVDYYSQPKTNSSTTGTPRKFWDSNPFKYDSSDDEDEGTAGKKKTVTVTAPAIPKCEFFFREDDPRFAGLTDYFCKRDEMDARIDYDEKRRELRSIVKAKARNAKRKDEKRTVAIKRAIRKKRNYRKTLIKSGSSNAMKIGSGKSD